MTHLTFRGEIQMKKEYETPNIRVDYWSSEIDTGLVVEGFSGEPEQDWEDDEGWY